MLRELVSHPQTRFHLSEAGKVIPPYAKTYSFSGEAINDHHRSFAECRLNGVCIDIGIEGWLRPADAQKLYELAYFATGDILELGCYRGLSTHVLALALRDAGAKYRFVSNDLSAREIEIAKRNLSKDHLDHIVDFRMGDAADVCRALGDEHRKFSFVFVDHSHAYDPVLGVCKALPSILTDGGFCLFHDYNDERNAEAGNSDYGVWQAVHDGLPPDVFQFYGTYGCTGLFRKLPLS